MLCIVWGNSMLSTEDSGSISHFIADILGGGAGSASDEGHFLLRKVAHFTEYAVLGLITALLFDSFKIDNAKQYLCAAVIGVSVPLIDETIQIFSGRGPALADVWIDISGFALGAAVTFLVICKRRKGTNA